MRRSLGSRLTVSYKQLSNEYNQTQTPAIIAWICYGSVVLFLLLAYAILMK